MPYWDFEVNEALTAADHWLSISEIRSKSAQIRVRRIPGARLARPSASAVKRVLLYELASGRVIAKFGLRMATYWALVERFRREEGFPRNPPSPSNRTSRIRCWDFNSSVERSVRLGTRPFPNPYLFVWADEHLDLTPILPQLLANVRERARVRANGTRSATFGPIPPEELSIIDPLLPTREEFDNRVGMSLHGWEDCGGNRLDGYIPRQLKAFVTLEDVHYIWKMAKEQLIKMATERKKTAPKNLEEEFFERTYSTASPDASGTSIFRPKRRGHLVREDI